MLAADVQDAVFLVSFTNMQQLANKRKLFLSHMLFITNCFKAISLKSIFRSPHRSVFNVAEFRVHGDHFSGQFYNIIQNFQDSSRTVGTINLTRHAIDFIKFVITLYYLAKLSYVHTKDFCQTDYFTIPHVLQKFQRFFYTLFYVL